MNENTLKLNLIKQLISEGMKKTDIERALRNNKDCQIRNFYKNASAPTSLKSCIKLTLENKPDSKAEVAVLNILERENIPFIFQYKIGPYRADFLIDGFLIFEVDGPMHDKPTVQVKDFKRDVYLKKMGYRVYRAKLDLIIANPRKIVKNIQWILTSKGG